jgi:hypothetical protein
MQVLLTTPAIPEDRMKEITKASEGFVYLVVICIYRWRTYSLFQPHAYMEASAQTTTTTTNTS